MRDYEKDQWRAQVKRILDWEGFPSNQTVQRLLTYVVEELLAGHPVKESTIAADFYKKSLDPPDGSTNKRSFVRVDMGFLRDALSDYYFEKGKRDHFRIRISKKDGYTPQLTIDPDEPIIAPASAVISQLSATRKRAVVEFEYDHIEDILQLEPGIQRSCGDPTIRLKGIQLSSLLAYFDCSGAGYERLIRSWQIGRLAEELGFPIRAVRAAEEVEAELLAKRSPALETCITPIYDLTFNEDLCLAVRLEREGSGHLYDDCRLHAKMFTSTDGNIWMASSFEPIELTGPWTAGTELFVRDRNLPTPSVRFIRAEFRVVRKSASAFTARVALSQKSIASTYLSKPARFRRKKAIAMALAAMLLSGGSLALPADAEPSEMSSMDEELKAMFDNAKSSGKLPKEE